MLLYKFLILISLIALCYSITIDTKLGKIKGAELKSRNGRTYYAFTRIPYAKPPIGNLKLKNPQDIEPWKGILDATVPAQMCLQIPFFFHFLLNTTFGQDDCLYLNVYTPKITSKEKLPVMFYIHGGAFRTGTPGPRHSPGYFMDEDIVLVTIQYRVGTLGFLSFENDIIPGNFGMKDQAKALNWVKANIDVFGGNSNAITAFGDSAGGISVQLHMLSPKSRELLKGGISESGWFNKYWTFAPPGAAVSIATRVANKFNCNNKNNSKILECLQKVSSLDLIRAEFDFLFWDNWHPAIVYRMVRENPIEGAFLDFDPFTSTTDLPWIVGIVSEEGNFIRAKLLAQNASVTQQFIDNMDDYISGMLALDNYKPSKADLTITTKLIKQRYFRQPATVQTVQEDIGEFVKDSTFVLPMYDALRNHTGPVYQYYNTYRSGSSLVDGLGEFNLGTSHTDEILLLFNWTEYYPKTKPKDVIASKTIVKMWTNFAKYSNPSIKNVEWPELRSSRGKYLQFSEQPTLGYELAKGVYSWWSNLPVYRSKRAHVEL